MKAVASVFSTTDYSSFKKLNGNREVMESRKKLLMDSIVERGWIRNPIVVNEKMEIIDGQGRFEALKELRLPVEYVFATGATIQDCINLNVKQKNWTNVDYIASYAENGVEDYLILQNAINNYKHLGTTVIQLLLSRFATESGRIDKVRFMKQLSTHHIMLSPVSTIRQCLTVLERIYNYNHSKKNKVYFIPEYEKATQKTIR